MYCGGLEANPHHLRGVPELAQKDRPCLHLLSPLLPQILNSSLKTTQRLSGKDSACHSGATGDMGLIPGLVRSPGGGPGNPLQYSCLENPTGRGVWWTTVHGISKSQTELKQLSMCACIGSISLCNET